MSQKIAVFAASWHEGIVKSAQDGFVEAFSGDDVQVDVYKVPGSLEIPLAGQKALQNGYDVAVGIGFVTDGKIYHREFVAHTVVQSILDASLATGKPFLSVVLAPQNFEEGNADDEKWFTEHMYGKGVEAAMAAKQMLDLLPSVKA